MRLEPDADERARIAADLGLESLPALVAKLTLKPWLDGVEITGRFGRRGRADLLRLAQNPFQHPLEGVIEVRAVPKGSPNATEASGGELDYDPEAPDPPDVLDGETIDLAGYVVEHLALEIDPFARKPGVEFEYSDPAPEESPFAVLRNIPKREP